jgi:dihydrodipicolinate synthase/N-acetylneuraminate lyase
MYGDLIKLSDRIVGVKETVFSNMPDVRFWYGDDSEAAKQGGYGLISAIANVAPELSLQIANQTCQNVDLWLNLVEEMYKFPNPLCIKRKLMELGVIKCDITRFPISIYK